MSKPGQLTAAIKREITNDWAKAFPTLGVFSPMRLLKRHGPLLVGVNLERTRSNDVYLPSFHVHNLLVPCPSILLSLIYPVPDQRKPALARQIKVLRHADDYLSAAAFLKQTITALESPVLHWPQIVELHCDFIRQKRDYAVAKFCASLFQDVILLAHWCGHLDYARQCQQEAAQLMQKWNPPIDISAWQTTIQGLLSRDTMEKTLVTELDRHKLRHLPVCELKTDGVAESISQAYATAWL